jgi:hypothetical protein
MSVPVWLAHFCRGLLAVVAISALCWLLRQLKWRDSQYVALVAAPFDRVGVGLLSYAQVSCTGHACR